MGVEGVLQCQSYVVVTYEWSLKTWMEWKMEEGVDWSMRGCPRAKPLGTKAGSLAQILDNEKVWEIGEESIKS